MESLLWHTVQHYPPHSEKVSSVNRLPILLAAAVIGLSACSPLLRDPFHSDRWDYAYEISRNGVVNQAETRNLTVWFENDRLVKAEGNALEYARQQQSAATE